MLRGVQQLAEILLPEDRPGMSAVPVSLVGSRNENEPTVFNVPDFALGDAQLRRVDKVIRRIYKHDRCRNRAHALGWIVIARGVHRIQEVVRVKVRSHSLRVAIQVIVSRVAGRIVFLHGERCTARDEEKVGRYL